MLLYKSSLIIPTQGTAPQIADNKENLAVLQESFLQKPSDLEEAVDEEPDVNIKTPCCTWIFTKPQLQIFLALIILFSAGCVAYVCYLVYYVVTRV